MSVKSIININKTVCYACYVCSLKCPVGAISMQEDLRGFYYPKVDPHKCTQCGLCLKLCPSVNDKKQSPPNKCYSLINNDENIKRLSSSGGAFLALAKGFFKKENCVIYAVELSNTFQAVYSKSYNFEQSVKFCKSKYIKSNPQEVYLEIQHDLLNDKNVLFVGTPCSVNALKNYLQKEYENLYTIDFVCHGTPSYKEFNSYLKSLHRGIKQYSFRHRYGNINTNSLIVFKNNKTKVAKPSMDDFLRAFDQNLLQMEACFNCNFADIQRCSDITLGDFWGIEKEDKNIKSNDGVSLIIPNSEKGYEILDLIENVFIKERQISTAIQGNPR